MVSIQHSQRHRTSLHILHIAAENGALPGAKEGGVADVVGDMTAALAHQGCRVTTLLPSYGFLHRLPGARAIASIHFDFRGGPQRAEIFDVSSASPHSGVRHCVLHHPWLEAYDPVRRRHHIYVHDSPDQPFLSDSNRFACFSAAAAAAVAQGLLDRPDVLHLHDWHTALIALLGRRDPACTPSAQIHTVFSIHNLGIQGIRPLSGHWASLEAWFPRLPYAWLDVADPNDPACINLMATGIRLADRIHTVSPGYADEIRHASRRPHFYGAEGLESVIAYAHDSGRLIGILNGITYPEPAAIMPTSTEPWPQMLQRGVLHWTAGHDRLPSEHFVAYQRLEALMRPTDTLRTILATVGRAVDQKMRLLREPGADGRTALDRILDNLGGQGIWIILGTGDPDYEGYLSWTAARRDNLIFLNGYSAAGADLLYATAHLFIMPSSYEPCGISQMLAMRHGCPCVVHRVGGLRDTIIDGCNGFSFQGWTIAEQVENFVTRTLAAIDMQRQGGENWETIRRRAAAARFQWDTAAREYCEKLYGRHC